MPRPCCRTVGDAVVPLVMPFVESNISKTDWRSREAATYAFGSILEGPSIEKLSPMVNSALDFLLNAMSDENSHVKDTTAWTLSRIFELMHSPASGFSVVNPNNLQRILKVLLESIKDAPHVAEKVCGAIYNLAQGYEDSGPSSSLLTPYLQDILSSLITTAERTDSSDSKLKISAYETLNEVVRCSNLSETSHIIANLLPAIMSKLEQTLNLQIVSSDDREKQGDLQASLCGALQVIIQKLNTADETKSIILQAADQIMLLLLNVFACRSSTVHEEAMLAIGALADAVGSQFAKYMPELYKYIETGLQNFEEYQICAISVGVVGDICRALKEKVLPYCDGIMTLLLKDLSSSELHHSVKPPIFSCFGDIALAIGKHFENYINYALPMMKSASEVCAQIDTSEEEMMEYGKLLRHSTLEAYFGILLGFKNSKAELMMPHAPHLLTFLELVAKDEQRELGTTGLGFIFKDKVDQKLKIMMAIDSLTTIDKVPARRDAKKHTSLRKNTKVLLAGPARICAEQGAELCRKLEDGDHPDTCEVIFNEAQSHLRKASSLLKGEIGIGFLFGGWQDDIPYVFALSFFSPDTKRYFPHLHLYYMENMDFTSGYIGDGRDDAHDAFAQLVADYSDDTMEDIFSKKKRFIPEFDLEKARETIIRIMTHVKKLNFDTTGGDILWILSSTAPNDWKEEKFPWAT